MINVPPMCFVGDSTNERNDGREALSDAILSRRLEAAVPNNPDGGHCARRKGHYSSPKPGSAAGDTRQPQGAA